MNSAVPFDAETEEEIRIAQEQDRKERRDVTAETAPAFVRRRIDLILSAIGAAPPERLLHLETLAVTSRALPLAERELGSDHPLVLEWKRLHRETVAWLHKDGMQRVFKNI